MKTKILGLLAVGLLAGPMSAQAIPDHVFSYRWNGSTLTTIQSDAGAQLLTGEVVGFQLSADGRGFWTATNNSIWSPLGISDCATRVGDLSWTLLLDGATVSSGSYANQGHSCVHIANPISPVGIGLNFDTMRWEYTSISSTSQTNILGNILGDPNNNFIFSTRFTAPEPGSLVLLGLGLMGLGLSRRRKTH